MEAILINIVESLIYLATEMWKKLTLSDGLQFQWGYPFYGHVSNKILGFRAIDYAYILMYT